VSRQRTSGHDCQAELQWQRTIHVVGLSRQICPSHCVGRNKLLRLWAWDMGVGGVVVATRGTLLISTDVSVFSFLTTLILRTSFVKRTSFFSLIRLAIRDAFCTTLDQMTTGRPFSFSLCFSETLRKNPNGGGTIPTRRVAPPLTASEFCVFQELVSSAETQLTTVTGPRRASGFCPVRSECSVIRKLVNTSLL